MFIRALDHYVCVYFKKLQMFDQSEFYFFKLLVRDVIFSYYNLIITTSIKKFFDNSQNIIISMPKISSYYVRIISAIRQNNV